MDYMGKALEQEMHEYFMRLSDAEKKSVLQMLKTFLKGRKEKIVSQTQEEYNRELDEAMTRVKGGKFTTLSALEKEMKAW